MLVLSRHVGEKILIGDDIEILVMDIRGHAGKVRLGITAPVEVAVDRAEVRESKDKEAERDRR